VKKILTFALAATLLTGCANALDEATDIRKPRVLAALVEVAGDPSRSTPAPGETVDVTLVIADPAERVARAHRFVVCVPAESDLDVGLCGEVVAGGRFETSTPDLAEPAFTLTVPDESVLGEAKELLVHGAVCAGGPVGEHIGLEVFPDTYTTTNPCLDPANVGELVTFRIRLARAPADVNHSPTIAAFTLDGEAWTASAAPDAPVTGCTALEIPMLPMDDAEHTLGLTVAPESREIYVERGSSKYELLYMGLYASAGEFPGTAAFFDGEDETIARFIPEDDHDPADVPDDGLLVRFTFVLRDGRGGVDFAERAVCVVPLSPPP
jgi:hypothetical protein